MDDDQATDFLAARASVKCRQRCWSARASSTSRSMRSLWRQAPPRTQSMRESWQVGGWVRMVAQGEGTRDEGAGMGWLVTGMVARCGGYCRHPPHEYCHVHHMHDLCALTATPIHLVIVLQIRSKRSRPCWWQRRPPPPHHHRHASDASAAYSLLVYCRTA